MSIAYFALFFLFAFEDVFAFKAKPCEVCVDVLTEVMRLSKENTNSPNQELIRKTLIDFCERVKNIDKKKQLCSFMGTYKESPTSIVNDIVKPLSFSKPPERVCKDINHFPEICALEYDTPIDWAELDKNLNKMRAKELREILNRLNDPCTGCTEKPDFIARIREIMPKPEKTDL